MSIPSLERLRADAAGTFHLADARGTRWPAELHSARPGVAMSPRYQCYSAQFALPDGVQLAQDLYDVQPPGSGESWNLLLVPIGPREDDGRALMEAVFHCLVAPVPRSPQAPPNPQAGAGQSPA